MARYVHVGGNVVVKCQSSMGENYQIMLCDKGLHMVIDNFTNGQGQEWVLGDWVIYGVWYEKT